MKNTILLVEDDPDHETLTLRALRKAGIKDPVAVARDGAEALDFLFGTGAHLGRDTTQTPRVVLLDLKLPKVDGIEVLQRMRKHELTRRIPVVVLTTSDEERDLVDSCDFGANDYIRKPVDFEQFIEATRKLDRFWVKS